MKTIIMIIFICSFTASNLLAQADVYVPKVPMEFVSAVGEQDEKEMLERLPPNLKNELLKVKELDPNKYKALLFEISYNRYDVYNLMGYMESYERERYETEKQVRELELFTVTLGIRYGHANDNEKPKIINDLKSQLNQLFDMKEKARSLEVELLSKELAQLKESLKVRKSNKGEIINRRLNELIGKGDYLDW
ncbi:MAG: hypothetical protein IH819_02980 [Bacteroidetes bacterium]|nr:hypothetical protein [Bacteroidota bacterium]